MSPVLPLVAVLVLAQLAPCVTAAQPIDAQLAGMSLERKVGQMILPRLLGSFQASESPELSELETLAREGTIGGAVLFAGSPYATRRIVERLETVSEIAPLIASDYEWGAAMRVEGATRLPRAMALGAAWLALQQSDPERSDPERADELVREHARITAREARAIGVGLVLAPVLDVVSAPSVIGTRSFGADPELVARLGALWIGELQAAGLLAVAKHYPGHGATDDDSHLGLPLVEAPLELLGARDLRPFEAALAAGVAGVMPGHIAVPALDGRVDRPASRSPEILARLRAAWPAGGVDGLIVSDALDMAGAQAGQWNGGVAVEAVAAGVDLLLLPPDPRVAHAAIVEAVLDGRLAEARIDEAVGRILRAKERIGLLRAERPAWSELDKALAARADLETADAIAEAALTLVDDPAATIPLSSRAPPRTWLLSVVRDLDAVTDTDLLRDELRRRAARVEATTLTASALASALPEPDRVAATAEVAVIAHYASSRDLAGLDEWLRALERRGVRTVVVAFADPWTLAELGPGEAAARAALVGWDPSAASQRALARGLFGERAIGGRLPSPLAASWPRGHGLDRTATVARLDDLRLREGWLDPAIDWRPVLDVLRGGVADGAYPGAVAVVLERGEVVLSTAVGRHTYEPDAPEVALDTIWDLASLTKVVATTSLAMMAVEEGRLDLDAPVSTYLPRFTGGGKDEVKVADLLAHSSGVLWWTDLHLRHRDWRAYLDEIQALPLETPPRTETRYSDLGILLLGSILERVFGRPYDELARTRIFEPLGMADTTFAPPAELLPRIAPTEVDQAWRGRLVHGEVHDENAAGVGGIAPHAGLFATGRDLAVFTQMILDGGVGNGRRLLNGATIQRFTRRAGIVPGSSRALGWDTPSQPSSAGTQFSERSFGHTGFTGTSMWIDPDRELIAILLTNRVHPTRERRGLIGLRGAFHDAVARAVDRGRPR